VALAAASHSTASESAAADHVGGSSAMVAHAHAVDESLDKMILIQDAFSGLQSDLLRLIAQKQREEEEKRERMAKLSAISSRRELAAFCREEIEDEIIQMLFA